MVKRKALEFLKRSKKWCFWSIFRPVITSSCTKQDRIITAWKENDQGVYAGLKPALSTCALTSTDSLVTCQRGSNSRLCPRAIYRLRHNIQNNAHRTGAREQNQRQITFKHTTRHNHERQTADTLNKAAALVVTATQAKGAVPVSVLCTLLTCLQLR